MVFINHILISILSVSVKALKMSCSVVASRAWDLKPLPSKYDHMGLMWAIGGYIPIWVL